VNFLGAVLANPEIVKAYVPDTQMIDDMGSDFFSFAEFYSHHVPPGDLPPAIVKGLERPTAATRIGGNTTVIDGYIPKEGKR
jgi:poly(beta-D-mannuronate) lyase